MNDIVRRAALDSNAHLMTTTNFDLVGDGDQSSVRLLYHCLVSSAAAIKGEVEIVVNTHGPNSFEPYATTIPIFVRTASPLWFFKVAAICDKNTHFAFYLDDNLFLLNGSNELSNFYQTPSVRRSLNYFLCGASVIYCHHDHFRQFLSFFNPNVKVLPTYFDFSLLNSPSTTDDEKDEFRIGIVINESKVEEIEFICPIVNELLKTTPANVIFEIFGHMPTGIHVTSRIRLLPPIKEYAAYLKVKQSRNWSLGLAPLSASEFSTYKTDNKYREFGGLGIAGIYSNSEPYKSSIENGTTGLLLANDQAAWVDAIRTLIFNPILCHQIGIAAKADIQKRYDIEKVSKIWFDSLNEELVSKNKRLSASIFTGYLAKAKRAIFKLRNSRLSDRAILQFGSGGWIGAKPRFIKANGICSHQVCASINPGEVVFSSRLCPRTSEYIWVLQLFTFQKTHVYGQFELELFNEMGIAVASSKYSVLKNGECLSLRVASNLGDVLTAKFVNKSDSCIGLLLLTPQGETKWEGSAHTLPGAFFT